MEPTKMTACRTAEAVNKGELSAQSLIEAALVRCNDLNGRLNLFVAVAGQEALEQAQEVDKKVKSGLKLPLAGVSVALKDDFCYSALPTSFGSPVFKKHRSPVNAVAVEKLIDAGAVIIGKTNLDDMGMGSTTAYSPFGPSFNPWSADRVAGSAGCAAVAAGACHVALDSDSGGALRQGASHCGVYGLRPTVGRVSRYGLNMFSSSFGQVGLAALSGDDILTVLKVVSGFDDRDVATASCKDIILNKGFALKASATTIGCPADLIAVLENDQRGLYEEARAKFAGKGFQMADLELEMMEEALRAYHVITAAESSSNLSRYDGIRFGEAADAESLDDMYNKTRRFTFGPEGRRRSIFGTFLLSEGNYDLYYRQALRAWRGVRTQFTAAFEKCDFLLLPAVRAVPHQAAKDLDFCRLYDEDIFCAPVSMAGLPSLCFPAGKVEHLPFGLQLVGKPFGEEALVEAVRLIDPEIEMPLDKA